MTPEEKIERNRKFAESYRDTYLRPVGTQSGDVEGGTYADWKFARDATLLQPEFCGADDGGYGLEPIMFDMFTTSPGVGGTSGVMETVAEGATMAGTAYAISSR